MTLPGAPQLHPSPFSSVNPAPRPDPALSSKGRDGLGKAPPFCKKGGEEPFGTICPSSSPTRSNLLERVPPSRAGLPWGGVKRLLGIAALGCVLACSWLAMRGFAATQSTPKSAGQKIQAEIEQEASQTQSKRSKEKIIEQKLANILANQELILKRFDEVMEELRVIKVRATR